MILEDFPAQLIIVLRAPFKLSAELVVCYLQIFRSKHRDNTTYLEKRRSYKKFVRKMLLKLTPEHNRF